MNPYLNFPNGDCKAAFALYQQVFGATCLFSQAGGSSGYNRFLCQRRTRHIATHLSGLR